jgi:hypothetical protein
METESVQLSGIIGFLLESADGNPRWGDDGRFSMEAVVALMRSGSPDWCPNALFCGI